MTSIIIDTYHYYIMKMRPGRGFMPDDPLHDGIRLSEQYFPQEDMMNHADRECGKEAAAPSCVNLRKLAAGDVDLLQRISRRTFTEAFGAGNDPENLRLFLDTAYSKRQLTHELFDPDASFWLLELDSIPVGYIMTRIKRADESGTCPGDEIVAVPGRPVSDKTAFELERIYVLAAHQGKGYGKLLMSKAADMADKGGFRKMHLLKKPKDSSWPKDSS